MKFYVHPDIGDKEMFDRDQSHNITDGMLRLAGTCFECEEEVAKYDWLRYGGFYWHRDWLLSEEEYKDHIGTCFQPVSASDIEAMF